MKKRESALKAVLRLLIITLIMQMFNEAVANPAFHPPRVQSFPVLTILSPVENNSYNSNNQWFVFTVTKPEDWPREDYRGQIRCVCYAVDPPMSHIWDGPNQPRVVIQDALNVANPPLNFTLSIPLKGLSQGEHNLQTLVVGSVNNSGTGSGSIRVNFRVDNSEIKQNQTVSPSISNFSVAPIDSIEVNEAITIAISISVILATIIIGIGITLYRKKLKRPVDNLKLKK